ncbi:MAG: DUF1937 family protein [Bdellovibrio sp.]
MGYFYISNPYNGSDEQKSIRAQTAARVCGLLLKKGVHAWSPIVHNHAMMSTFNEFSLEERQTLMLEFDFSLLRGSSGMIVLEIEGWDTSFGVQAEINLCKTVSLPVKYLTPADLEENIPLNSVLRDKPHKISTI